MGFFEDLGKKIGSATDTAADKARKLAETSKLKSAISVEERKIDLMYTEIGQKFFEQDKDNPESPAADLCEKIKNGLKEIAQYQAEIEAIKGS